MPEYFQKPENALRKAQEFLDVGKQKPALDVLSDVLRSKKHRTWQKIHEPIIHLYLELCVELRKSQAAKEGLYQYKIICQQVNTKSLEDAVTLYLNLAEVKTKEAREKSAETALKMVEDLDMIESPEGMLLRAVTGEQTQDRTDRLLLMPWVKYLWESYRQCLDLLRNNCRVEKLYHIIAQKAFKFCLNYDRRTEFRKLCDNLRNHVKLSEQRHSAQFSVNLSNPDTQALHLETRISQLDAAVKIELWQEAFKAVEDIHYLMSLSKRPPKPQTLANFHTKLSLVFWKADSMLFHACARHKLFRLTKDMKKNPSMDDLTRMASLMLVATLAIPITEQKHGIGKILDMEGTLIDKHLTLSKLLGLDRPPTRDSLIEDFVRFNLLQFVPRQLRELYQWLEKDFHPLRLTEKVAATLQWMKEQTREPELVQYIPQLQGVIISKVLQQISSVYQTIEFSHLMKLLPFCTPFQLEQVIVDAARNGQLQVRIDHTRGCLMFGTDLNASPLYVEDDFFETKRLQALPSEQMSDRFNQMAKALLEASNKLKVSEAEKAEAEMQEQSLISYYQKTKQRDHQNMLQRKFIIEQRKEQLEHLNQEREAKEQRAVQEQEEAVKEAEKQRLDKEQKEREQRRKKEQEKEEQRRNATDRLEMIKKSEIGQKMLKDLDLDALDQINPDELMKKQMETLEKEKREMQERLRAQEKKVDYFERAKRLQEIPILRALQEEKRTKDAALWDKLEDERVHNWKKDQELKLQHKDRLARMDSDRQIFVNNLKETRQALYQEELVQWEKVMDEERAIRLARRKEQRKKDRKEKREKEKEEQRQREIDEKIKKEKEEERRLAREAAEAAAAAAEEKARQLEHQREMQLQREREIEEKQRQRQEEAARERARAAEPAKEDGARERESWRRGGQDDSSPQRRFPARDTRDSGNSWRRDDSNRDSPRKEAWRPRRAMDADGGGRRDFGSDRFGDRGNSDRGGFDRRGGGSGFGRDRGGFGGDRDDRDSRGGFDRREDRGGFGGDRGAPRDRGFDRTRDFERPSPRGADRGRDDGGSWRRRSPSPQQDLGRRRSPPGRRFSPPGRRDSPQGRSSPPPTGRRSSPAGRRSPAPMKGSWRSSGGDRDQGSWRSRGGDRDDGPPSRDNWRSKGSSDDSSFRGGRGGDDRFTRRNDDDSKPASRPWRPSRARNDDGPPPGGRSEQKESPAKVEEADDEWTTVSKPRR